MKENLRRWNKKTVSFDFVRARTRLYLGLTYSPFFSLASVVQELNVKTVECNAVKEELKNTTESSTKLKNNDSQRIRFLEKENLDLMLQTKVTQDPTKR